MTLRRKTLLIVSLTLVSLLVVLYVALSRILMRGFLQVEEQNAQAKVEQARAVLADVSAKISATTGDWAGWDDTHDFIQTNNPRYRKNLSDTAIADLRIDVMVYFQKSGRVLFGTGFDARQQRKRPLPAGLLKHLQANPALLQHQKLSSIKAGILLVPEAPLLLVSRPILTTKRTGPIAGTLLFGRLLDEAEVKRLSNLVGHPLTLLRADEAALPSDFEQARVHLSSSAASSEVFVRPLSESTVAGYTLLSDIYGKPALMLRAEIPRRIYRQGQVSLRYSLLSLLISGLVFSSLILILLQKLVLARWTQLSHDLSRIRASGDVALRVQVLGGDELAQVSRSTNQMLDALEQGQSRLRESEARFQAFMDHSPAVAFMKDEGGRYIYANRTFEHSFSLAPSEWNHKTDWDLWPPEVARALRDADAAVLAGGHALEIQESAPVGGVWLQWLSYKFPITGPEGRPFLAGISIDVTKQHEAQEAVRRSERFLQSTLDALTAHIAILDETGTIIEVNQAWRRFAADNGYVGTDCGVGENYLEMCSEAVDVSEEAARTAEGIRALIDQQQADFCLEYPCHSPDENRWFSLRATRFGSDSDGSTRVVVAHENISQRKAAEESLRESEQRFRQLAENINEVFWSFDPIQHQLLYVSPAYESIWGRNSNDLLKNPRLWYEHIHPEDRERVARAAANQQQAGTYNEEFRIVRPGGEVRWVHDQAFPLSDKDGHIYRVVGVAEDITERKSVEAALQRAHDELESRVKRRTLELSLTNQALRAAKEDAERANSAKGELLSRVSHELRTPMNAILGFSQILEMGELAPLQKESLQEILKAGHHLLTLIDHVLDLAHIEGGGVRGSTGPVSVGAVVRDSITATRALADERRVSINVTGEGHIDRFHVEADADLLRQVLGHLLSNAVAYNREGGSVTISCELQGAPQGESPRLRIQVLDSGRGIAAEDLPRLFMPFERLRAEEWGIPGTGLGLSLSKGFAEAMGGSIGVHSTPGQGSTFWIELPLSQPPTAALQVLAGEERAPDSNESAPHAPVTQVLYVEDNASNLRLMERIMEQRGDIRLISAARGEQGLELAQQHRPDLILLDLHLPDCNGDEVLARLRSDPRTEKVPVVMVSADATPRQIERLLQAGASDYLAKPIKVPHLLQVLELHLPHAADVHHSTEGEPL